MRGKSRYGKITGRFSFDAFRLPDPSTGHDNIIHLTRANERGRKNRPPLIVRRAAFCRVNAVTVVDRHLVATNPPPLTDVVFQRPARNRIRPRSIIPVARSADNYVAAKNAIRPNSACPVTSTIFVCARRSIRKQPETRP